MNKVLPGDRLSEQYKMGNANGSSTIHFTFYTSETSQNSVNYTQILFNLGKIGINILYLGTSTVCARVFSNELLNF